jgi:hypothetical protein
MLAGSYLKASLCPPYSFNPALRRPSTQRSMMFVHPAEVTAARCQGGVGKPEIGVLLEAAVLPPHSLLVSLGSQMSQGNAVQVEARDGILRTQAHSPLDACDPPVRITRQGLEETKQKVPIREAWI